MATEKPDYQGIYESYDARIARRLEYLLAVTGEIAASTEKSYEESSEADAFIAISALHMVTHELETVLEEFGLMKNILMALQNSLKKSA